METAEEPRNTAIGIEALTLLNDRRYATGAKKRNHVLYIVREALNQLFSSLPKLDAGIMQTGSYRLIDFETTESAEGAHQWRDHAGHRCQGFDPEG